MVTLSISKKDSYTNHFLIDADLANQIDLIFFLDFRRRRLNLRLTSDRHAPPSGLETIERYALGNSRIVDGFQFVCFYAPVSYTHLTLPTQA